MNRIPYPSSWPRLTVAGWVCVALLVGGALASWAWTWRSGLAVAAVCLVALMAALVSVVRRSPHSVHLELASRRVVAGEIALGNIVVHNPTPRRVTHLPLEVPINGMAERFIIGALPAGKQAEEPFAVPTTRRGVVTLGPPRTVRQDPFGLLRQEKSWGEQVEILVHPETARIPHDATGSQRDVEGVVTQERTSSDVAFHALRDYVPGDDRRSVHWRSTARVGHLVVRQFEATKRSRHLIVIDTEAAGYLNYSEDIAIAIAASLATQGLLLSRGVAVVANGLRLPGHSPLALLDACARLELEDSGQSLAHSVSAALGLYPSISMLTVITGQANSEREIAGALRLAGPNVRKLGVRVAGTKLLRHTVLGIEILSVESLKSAQRAIARSFT